MKKRQKSCARKGPNNTLVGGVKPCARWGCAPTRRSLLGSILSVGFGILVYEVPQ